jgi:hypothetical protein
MHERENSGPKRLQQFGQCRLVGVARPAGNPLAAGAKSSGEAARAARGEGKAAPRRQAPPRMSLTTFSG